jgi:hypothetical protein
MNPATGVGLSWRRSPRAWTQRLDEGRVFNLFSPTLPILFEKKDKIRTKIETTEKGSIVTQTSDDSTVVAALQAHAVEVSELPATA